MVTTRLVLLLLAFLIYAHGLAAVSPSPTVTPSRSPTPSQTASRSRTPSFSPSRSRTPSVSPTKGGVTPTQTPSKGGPSATPSSTPSGTLSRTPTPSVGGSASGTSSATSTRTGALLSPSSTASPTSSPTPTVTPTPAVTPSTTPSTGSSPTSTSSSTFSPTPTASPTATNGGTPSSTTSPSTTSTPSPSTSTTATTNVTSEVFTPSPTPSPTTSPTPTSSVTPTFTPTPSVTSTPIACSIDFRTSRTYPCSTPTLNLSTSIYPKNGYPFTTPNLPLTSYPILSATLSMVFPSLPAPGEALGLKCSVPSEPTLFTLTLPPNPFSSQGRAPFSVPLQISPTSLSPFPSHGVTCTLTSSTSATYPFALNVSTQFASTPSTMPFVSMILAESASSPGLFRGLAGLPSGPLQPLPLFDTSCSPLSNISTSATNSSATNSTSFPLMPYNSSQFSSCPAAISSLETYLSGLNATIAPSFSTTLSGSTTLLLVSSPFSAPFNATTLNVSLGGIPCRINWVSPSGTIMSITSPTLVALCGGNAAAALAGVGDCGVATLLLLTNTTSLDYAAAAAAAAASGSGGGGGYSYLPPLPLPAAYPPLQPSLSLSPNSPAYSATTSLAGLPDIPSILDTAASLSSSTQGIRVVAICTDPAYAPPETCSAVVTGWLQPDVPRGKSCAWGGGDNCVPCPVGALCPGGAQMYPLPGYWCPFLNSPPSTLVQCPEPDSTLRCPGYLPDISSSSRSATNATRGRPSTSSYSSVTARCGEGYTGTACAVCAPGFEPGGGNTCVACPSFSSYGAALILPALPFVGGLLLVGCTLLLLFYVSLQVRECRKRTSSRLAGGVGSGGDSTAAGDVEEEEGGGTLAWEGSPIVSTPATAGGASPSIKGGASKGGSESPSNLYSAVPPVGSVLLWLWLAGQGSASLFTQAQGIAPSYFSPLYGTLSALQFQGLSANPMCFTLSIPFQSFWACVIYLCLCVLAVVGSHACMVTARRRAGRGKLGGCCYSNTKPFAAHINPSTGGVGGGGGGGGKAGGGGKKRWLCENPPRTLLVLAVTALLVGYGATIGVLTNALTCSLPTPMSLWGYVEAVSDGSTYRKQLGGEGGVGEAALAAAAAGFPTPLPSMAELRAVYNDPYLPANYHLRTLMQSIYFPVSLLATDPYQVCGEGPHRVVWGVALTLLILHSLGLPILGCCVLWYMGHLKGLKGALAKLSARFCSKGKGALSGGYVYSTRWGVVEMYSRGGSKGGKKREGVVPNSSFRWAGEQVDGVAISTTSSPSPSSPSGGSSSSSNPSSLPPKLPPTPPPINPNSLFSHLHAALYNDALRRPFFWYPYAEMYVLVVLVGLVALSKRADSVQLFDAAMGGIAAVALSWALFLSRTQPYVKEHAWKKTPAIGLQLLTGLTSVFNALSHRALGASGPSRLALGVVPLVFALLLFIGIVGAWWFSGYEFGNTGWKMAPEETAAVAAAAALLTPQPPPPRSPTPSTTALGARVGEGVVVQRNPLAEIAAAPAPSAVVEEADKGDSVVEEAAVGVESSEHLLLHPPPPPSMGPYQRYTDPSDGDVFWFCGASGQSVYVLPEGSSTACGWVGKGGGVWEHLESGVISSTPPSLNVEEMDAYVMANRAPPPQLPPSPPLPPAAVVTAVPAETTPVPPPLPSVEQQGQQEERVVVEEGVQQPGPLATPTPPSAPLPLPPPAEDEQHHHKVRSKQESLAAAATALRKTKALRLFRGKGETMTQVEAATLLQVQWRRLRASRSAELWRKIKALEGGKSGKGVGGGGGGGGSDEQHTYHGVELPNGWVRKSNRLTGKHYFMHLSGKVQWEVPKE